MTRLAVGIKGMAIAIALCAVFAADGAHAAAPPAVLAQLPLSFELNRGQAPAPARFIARGRASTLELGRGRARLALRRGALRLQPVGGTLRRPVAGERLPGRVNYLVGSDRSRWRTGIETFGQVSYRDVWPGVDLTFHGREGALEYDFEVAPGADVRTLVMRLAGARSLRLDERGDLRARVGGGVVKLRHPISYQLGAGGKREPVRSRFAIDGDTVRVIVGAFDRSRRLVIDPTISYATYLGGGAQDGGSGIAVDPSGAVYVAGQTLGSFPTTPGAFQGVNSGFSDAFVAKLNPEGSALVYSTYVGGSLDEALTDIAVDAAGAAYLTGQTGSADYPTTPGAVQPTSGGEQDAFVTKLSPDGGALVYSTFLGGAGGSEGGEAIAVDGLGAAYVTGVAAGMFPTTPGSYQPLPGLSLDAFVTKLSPSGGARVYSTYIGGTTADQPRGIAVDGSGAAYVTGYTLGGYPTTPGAFQTTYGGNNDAFVSKLSADGSALSYSTYLGGGGLDRGLAIAVGEAGDAVVSGEAGAGFPTTVGALKTAATGTDAFLTRLSAAGSGLAASTLVGGDGTESGYGVALATDGSVFLAGTAQAGYPTTADAQQGAFGGGGTDAFLSRLDAGLGTLLYSSYFGGPGDDVGFALAVRGAFAHLTGWTTGSLPTTEGAVQAGYGGGVNDAFVAKIDLTPPAPPPPPIPTATPIATPGPSPAPTPTPLRGKTFNLSRTRGKVLVRLPGTRAFVDVATVRTIPTGTIVDATAGRAKLFAAATGSGDGGMEFYAGMFRVSQATAGDPAVSATLVGGDLSGCPKRSRGYKRWAREQRTLFGRRVPARSPAAAQHARRRTKRRLWGSGKGRYRTAGHGGSAAVRGTRWLTEDGCNGTLVRVAEGVVLVRDRATGSTINVRAGQRVTAPFSRATLRRIQRGGKRVGTLTAKGRRAL